MYQIFCISDSDKHFASAIGEYEKRLGKKLTIQTIKPTKHGTREQIIKKDTENMIKSLSKAK